MKNVLVLLVAGFVLVSCTSVTTSSLAAELPNILILGDDSDRDSIARNSRVFKRVVRSISNEISGEGFDVFDETAITLDGFTQGRTRRTDAELIDISRSIQRPPIDVSIIFTIYTRKKSLSYTVKVNSRVEGRLLNVRTGQRLGNFEVESPRSKNVPKGCDRQCLLEVVGSQAKELSEELGAVLTQKLAHIVDTGPSAAGGNLPSAYTLVFAGFKMREVDEIEEYLTSFRGYKSHRPIGLTSRKAEYWYKTSSDSARLNRNIRKMVGHLGFEARITFNGDEIKVHKIKLRKRRN